MYYSDDFSVDLISNTIYDDGTEEMEDSILCNTDRRKSVGNLSERTYLIHHDISIIPFIIRVIFYK